MMLPCQNAPVARVAKTLPVTFVPSPVSPTLQPHLPPGSLLLPWPQPCWCSGLPCLPTPRAFPSAWTPLLCVLHNWLHSSRARYECPSLFPGGDLRWLHCAGPRTERFPHHPEGWRESSCRDCEIMRAACQGCCGRDGWPGLGAMDVKVQGGLTSAGFFLLVGFPT